MSVPKAIALGSSTMHRCCFSTTSVSPRVLNLVPTTSRIHSRNMSMLAKREEEVSSELDAMMEEDLQQFAAQQPSKAMAGGATSSTSEASEGGIKETLDKVLIADFFFILFVLLWFGVGVGLQVGKVTTGPLDLWYLLWQPVFQPALGVLMLGALVSGLTGKKDQ